MHWSVSEAKAKLSEVLKRSRRHPQVIENHGEVVAVLVSKTEWDRLSARAAEPKKTAMAEFFEFTDRLKKQGPLDLVLPPRELEKERPDPFDDVEEDD